LRGPFKTFFQTQLGSGYGTINTNHQIKLVRAEAGFYVRVHPDPCLILIRAQIRAVLCASKSKFIPAYTLTLPVLDKKNGHWLNKATSAAMAAWSVLKDDSNLKYGRGDRANQQKRQNRPESSCSTECQNVAKAAFPQSCKSIVQFKRAARSVQKICLY
jgi:hypothetical protein